jgi:hypothetical protein
MPDRSGQRTAASAPPARNEADMRHKLHLSLGNGAPSHNGPAGLVFPPSDRPPIASDRTVAPAQAVRPPYPAPDRAKAAGFSEAGPGSEQPLRPIGEEIGSGAGARKEAGGSFIDQELRARVETDIATFLVAFDAALADDTQENRSALREATDRLLRAGARTRIELERLEARVPLTVHDRGGDRGVWRYR